MTSRIPEDFNVEKVDVETTAINQKDENRPFGEYKWDKSPS